MNSSLTGLGIMGTADTDRHRYDLHSPSLHWFMPLCMVNEEDKD